MNTSFTYALFRIVVFLNNVMLREAFLEFIFPGATDSCALFYFLKGEFNEIFNPKVYLSNICIEHNEPKQSFFRLFIFLLSIYYFNFQYTGKLLVVYVNYIQLTYSWTILNFSEKKIPKELEKKTFFFFAFCQLFDISSGFVSI